MIFQISVIRDRYIQTCQPYYRCIQVTESFAFHYACRDFTAKPSNFHRFMNHKCFSCLDHRFDNRIHIQRFQSTRIDDFDLDAFFG